MGQNLKTDHLRASGMMIQGSGLPGDVEWCCLLSRKLSP